MRSICALAVAALAAPSAHAQLYGAGPWLLGAPFLHEIDTQTGQATEIGRLLIPGNFIGMTSDGDRLLIATPTNVYEVSTENAETTLLYSLGGLNIIEGAIAADPVARKLYLANRTQFARLDLDTGAVEFFSDSFNGLDLSGMTFDSDGRLLAIYFNGGSSQIRVIDTTTGARSLLNTFAAPLVLPNVTGFAYDTITDGFYATANDTLYDFTDLENPVAVGAMGVEPISGLAYLHPNRGCVPDFAEPFGELNFNDVVGFLTAFAAMDPAADLTDPFGELNFNDVIAFLAFYAAGCP